MNNVAFLAILISLTMMQCSSSSEGQDADHKYTNHLIDESSPYLLQHAHNPVDWYPWGEAALEKAQSENKLIIISIGYAACHWCHVMEHESFEDSAVATIMNEHFVSIKVDREERPDIDDVYMSACQLASGRGCGWPLNAFALPDGRPVWAGTYFPKKDWMQVLNYFIELKANEPEKLTGYAEQLVQGIQQNNDLQLQQGEALFTAEALDEITRTFVKTIDMKRGGRTGAPKFPMPNNYAYLMRYAHLRADDDAGDAVRVTLDNMARGGIYDQVGGGFARYSVDAKWHVPHFEKMLYDNGQLVSLYARAYTWTEDPLYARIVRETLAFVGRELTDQSGGFYSSLDADSEGVEGKFYVWTEEEVHAALAGSEHLELVKAYFDIKKAGNWEDGVNVLQIPEPDAEFAEKHGISKEAWREIIEEARKALFEKRNERVRPGLDDKILTSWNALMLKGYLDAYAALGNEQYLQAALKNARFVRENMFRTDGGLNRNYKDGKSTINAFLDDYAILMEAWIALYQATFDEKWLNEAREFAVYVQRHFLDEETGMFFYTSDLDPPLVARNKETNDNVIPASNSILANALHKLGLYFYDDDLLTLSKNMLLRMAPAIESSQQPGFYSNWCDLYADHVWPLYEVAIVGADYGVLQSEMMRQYLPQALTLGGASEGSLELLANKLQEGETYIYVCQNKVCKFPVTTVDAAIRLMKG